MTDTRQLTDYQTAIITATREHLKGLLSGEATGHDYWHCERVWKLAKKIGQTEADADRFVLELAALLHDISDWKFNGGDETVGPRLAHEFLKSRDVPENQIRQVTHIIANMSYKGAKVEAAPLALEGQIVQDADRLDALGAIGLARVFAYGAFRGQEIHNPDMQPNLHASSTEYKHAKGTSINHFYEKLLLLKDRMNTAAGRSMAQDRHQFLVDFLDRFLAEWQCA